MREKERKRKREKARESERKGEKEREKRARESAQGPALSVETGRSTWREGVDVKQELPRGDALHACDHEASCQGDAQTVVVEPWHEALTCGPDMKLRGVGVRERERGEGCTRPYTRLCWGM